MSEDNKMILSEYHGHKETAGRSATVIKEKGGLAVELYEFEHMVEKRPVHNHSEAYAENCAENYVLGVFDVGSKV